MSSTNWSDTLSLSKFDTSLGTLSSIRFDLSGIIEGIGKAENEDAAPSTVTLKLGSELKLTRPDESTLVIANPLFSQVFNFSAFDGSIDYSGSSGGSTGTISASSAQFFVSSTANDFALFSALGGGTINLGLTANGTSNSSGAGNLTTKFNTAAAGNVLVTYTYTPTVAIGEPASLATMLAGLGLIGALRRRPGKKA